MVSRKGSIVAPRFRRSQPAKAHLSCDPTGTSRRRDVVSGASRHEPDLLHQVVEVGLGLAKSTLDAFTREGRGSSGKKVIVGAHVSRIVESSGTSGPEGAIGSFRGAGVSHQLGRDLHRQRR
jgi:hypothetical protein